MPRRLYLVTCTTGALPHQRYLDRLADIDIVLALKAPCHIGCFDGLLLLGGGDIDPALFGERVVNDTVKADVARDRLEIALIQQFAAAGKPIFGICRGIQILNVALGGTLVQDLPAQRGIDHSNGRLHDVSTLTGSRTNALWGPRFTVNSYHHQAVGRLAPGLMATAVSEDGVIEAVEHKQLPLLAVQWHPEIEPFTPEFFDLLHSQP